MKKIIYLGLYLGVAAAIFTALLAATNEITAPRIAQIQEENFLAALLQSFPGATDFEILDDTADYTLQIIQMRQNDEVLGYVYSQEVRGFVDVIRYLIGIDTDGYYVSFIVLSSRETPGFGTRINNEEWRSRIIDQHGSTQIDTLTSATVTTEPIIRGLEAVYQDFLSNRN